MAITWAVALTHQAVAQSTPALDDMMLPAPGKSESFPQELFVSTDSSMADIGATVAGASAFLKEYKSNVHRLRNAHDITVYRDAAPAVVLVVTNDGLGSGSLLENKTIFRQRVKLHRRSLFARAERVNPPPEQRTFEKIVSVVDCAHSPRVSVNESDHHRQFCGAHRASAIFQKGPIMLTAQRVTPRPN